MERIKRASTWVSDMTSKLPIILVAAASLCLLASCSTPGNRDTGIPVSRLESKRLKLAVTGDVAQLCKDVLGYDYPSAEIAYWKGAGDTGWILITNGKHGLITSRFEISNGSIASSVVLSHKEQRGKQIASKSFLRQFSGVSLSRSRGLSKRVDAISGATVSSRAMTDAAMLALRLHNSFVDEDRDSDRTK